MVALIACLVREMSKYGTGMSETEAIVAAWDYVTHARKLHFDYLKLRDDEDE